MWRKSRAATWPASQQNTGGDLTEWQYHPRSGDLVKKLYNATTWLQWDYLPGGPLQSKRNCRGQVTTFDYDALGRLEDIIYPAGSFCANVSMTYDPRGRMETLTDAAGTHSFMREDGSNLLQSESINGGLLSGLYTGYGRDALGRQAVFSFGNAQNSSSYSNDRTYTENGLLHRVHIAGDTTRYIEHSYQPNSRRLRSRESFTGTPPAAQPSPDTRTRVLSAVHLYGARHELLEVTNTYGTGANAGNIWHKYTYDTLLRRTKAQRESPNGKTWHYGYNDRSEVTSAHKTATTDAASTTVKGWKAIYNYDAIGNRSGLWVTGEAERSTSYTTHPGTTGKQNLYSAVTQASGGKTNLLGQRSSTAPSVSVNGGFAQVQNLDWCKELSATGSNPLLNVTIAEGGVTQKTGLALIPPASITPTYDDDGNLTFDGIWTYTWDTESRLVSVSRPGGTAAGTPAGNVDGVTLTFAYDAYGRRIRKLFSKTPVGGSLTHLYEERYSYDGWNLVGTWRCSAPGQAGAQTLTLRQEYVWGGDLSGTPQGAGGIGGLLLIRDTAPAGSGGGTWFPCYDGNGNLMALIDAINGGPPAAEYEYDAFGKELRATGPAAERNPFRFSTKYTDLESSLVYYGYRYYHPDWGRWLSRDPIGEHGGVNLLSLCANNPNNRTDYLGLFGERPIVGEVMQDHHWFMKFHKTPRLGQWLVDMKCPGIGVNIDDYTTPYATTPPAFVRKHSSPHNRVHDGYKELYDAVYALSPDCCTFLHTMRLVMLWKNAQLHQAFGRRGLMGGFPRLFVFNSKPRIMTNLRLDDKIRMACASRRPPEPYKVLAKAKAKVKAEEEAKKRKKESKPTPFPAPSPTPAPALPRRQLNAQQAGIAICLTVVAGVAVLCPFDGPFGDAAAIPAMMAAWGAQ